MANAWGGPVVDGAHLEVVFAHPEGVLHLPQAAVLAQDGGVLIAGGLRQVGDDPVQAVPALRLGYLVRVDAQGGLPFYLQVLLVAVVVEQVFGVVALSQFFA